MNFQIALNGVLRLDDGAFVPNDVRNLDWTAYQKWVVDGGVPRPLQPGPQYDWSGSAWVVNPQRQALIDAITSQGNDLTSVRADNAIVAFLKMSPAEIDNYVNTNITGANAQSINSIKTILSTLAKVVSATARDRIIQ